MPQTATTWRARTQSRAAAASLGLALLSSLSLGLGCAAMRQSLKGQEISHRGVYACPGDAGCDQKEMKRSTSGTQMDGMTVTDVHLAPVAALAYTAESPFERLEAKIADCKGNSIDVAPERIVPAGEHKVGDALAKESWMIVVHRDDVKDLVLKGKGECAVWKVTATAHWPKDVQSTHRVGLRPTR